MSKSWRDVWGQTPDARQRCRKCRGKLPVPTDNLRRAFCTKFCHQMFYRSRCIVCEKEFRRRSASQKLCGHHDCRRQLDRFPLAYTFPSPYIKKPEAPPRSAHSTASGWRHIAGPALSPTAFRLATLDPPAAASRSSRLRASSVARPTVIGSRTMPPQVRNVFEWLDAGAPVVEAQPANAVPLTASSRIAESKLPGDSGPMPAFLLRTAL